jgi:DNA-directed RNA polymerase specialized sigma24 family protein
MEQPRWLQELMQTQEYVRLVGYFRRREAGAEAEDLAHEVLLRLLGGLLPTATLEHARQLLWRIAPQRLIDFRRSTWRGWRNLDDIDPSRLAGGDDPCETAADRELALFWGEELGRERFGEAVIELLQGLRWEDISAILGVTEPTARKHLGSAYARVLVRMAERKLESPVLNRWEAQHGGVQAGRIIRKWAEGREPEDVAALLDLPVTEVVAVMGEIATFFARELTRLSRAVRGESG